MLKKRIIRALMLSTIISTGTLVACAMWYTITLIINSQPILSAQIPFVTLFEILSVGVVCGAGTEMILFHCDENPVKAKIRLGIHYVFINAVVLVCGYFYGWYALSISGVLLMCLTSAAVYAFTFYLGYFNERKTAAKMNEKLQELKKAGK